jgi:hypothetical protein
MIIMRFCMATDSDLYKQNKEAINKSIQSFVPANYLVKYFDSPKVEYFSHGVDTEFFQMYEMMNPQNIMLYFV